MRHGQKSSISRGLVRSPSHRYHGVFAPNAPLRPLVTARALEDNALTPEAPGPPPDEAPEGRAQRYLDLAFGRLDQPQLAVS